MRSPALNAPTTPESDVVAASAAVYMVQVRYPGSDWVTVTRLPRLAAIRAAARAYRDDRSPEGWSPQQVRLIELQPAR
jgi:hypothetical protein